MEYQPKKSTKRWLEGAPNCILACYNNGGKTIDRYTVLLGKPFWCPEMGRTVPYIAMSNNPSHPQGISIYSECQAFNRSVHGKKVKWLDLPKHIRKHVIFRIKE